MLCNRVPALAVGQNLFEWKQFAYLLFRGSGFWDGARSGFPRSEKLSDLRASHSSLLGLRVSVTPPSLRSSKCSAGHPLPVMKVEID